MKTLTVSLMAAALVLMASGVYAGMASHETAALDSSNHAVVSINEASSPIAVLSQETVSLDSNGIWLASDYSNVASETGMAGMAAGSSNHGRLYCFDSLSRFCAVAY